MNTKEADRRRFFKEAALAGLAVGSLGALPSFGQAAESDARGVKSTDSRNLYGQPSRFETAGRVREDQRWRYVWFSPLENLQGIVTPSGLHFYNTHYGIPDLDPKQHRLLIHGTVDRPLIFTMDELKRLPSVSRVQTIECITNNTRSLRADGKTASVTHGYVSCSEWTGVPLSLLLKEAGLQTGAAWVVAEAGDTGKRIRCIPLEKAMDDVLIAYAQNGEAVRPEQGYPLRFLVPGWDGDLNIKYLRRLKVVAQPYMPSAPSPKTNKQTEWQQPVRSVITFPSGGQRLAARGFYQITGFAWSGGGTVRRVEVSTDGGQHWKDAGLQEPIFRKALTRFRFDWTWNGQEALLQSRATDDLGHAQPTLIEFSKGQGVDTSYWTKNRLPEHANPIHTWKLAQDGSIQNAFA